MKRNRGITLVALVITIIILLILAGIAISQLTQSGLFEKTQLAKEKSENAEKLENTILEEYESEMSKYIAGTRSDLPSTILYPEGTEENPPTITTNQRIEVANPFPGKDVYVIAQIYHNGMWGETGFVHIGGGYGVKATHMQGEGIDKIVIQSGSSKILPSAYDSGHGFGTNVDLTTAPYRIKVYQLN